MFREQLELDWGCPNIMTQVNAREIREVSRKDYLPFMLDIHYAKRSPSVSYAYGLYKHGVLEGIVTYGTPPSSTLRRGICGDEFIPDVLELNRLVLKSNEHNDSSWLIGNSLKLLPKNKIVVSFADTSQEHLGIVYQATNFIYTGLSAKRTDWKVKGKEHLHSQTLIDEFRGQPNRSKLIREKYGDDFYVADRPRKHRYIFITGSKTYKKKVLRNLKYPIHNYPKNNI
tara:strand:+ start:95 stop:778 length:684 start_codon:yes stop_codon:yes gene_type:complete